MGSREDLVTAVEAAELLGVTADMVHKMVRQGMLSPVLERGAARQQQHFHRSEVAAVAALRLMKLDLASVANLATRALAVAQRQEQQLEEVRALLGLRHRNLGCEEEEIVSLFVQAQDANETEHSPEEAREWASVFFGITEEYLRLVARHTATSEPWKPFLLLGEKLVEEGHAALVEAARRHLRQVAYFYLRNQEGQRVAHAKFPHVEGGIDETMIGLLFLH